MSNHHPQSKGAPAFLNVIAGLVLVAVGSSVLYGQQVPVPGLELNIGKTVAMIGMLLLLFPVVRTFYTQPLRDAISERTKNLEETFSEAEDLKARMDAMKQEYEARLAETEAAARAQIQEQIKQAQDLRKQLEAEARSRADELVKKAQEEIAAERDRVISDLRLSTVNLTLAATEKILGENLDQERNKKLIEDFIAHAEVPG